ncbi:hypothetical protein [Rhizobium sp. A37_96]
MFQHQSEGENHGAAKCIGKRGDQPRDKAANASDEKHRDGQHDREGDNDAADGFEQSYHALVPLQPMRISCFIGCIGKIECQSQLISAFT